MLAVWWGLVGGCWLGSWLGGQVSPLVEPGDLYCSGCGLLVATLGEA